MIESGRALPSLKLLARFCEHYGFNFNLAKLYLYHDKVNAYKREVHKKLALPEMVG